MGEVVDPYPTHSGRVPMGARTHGQDCRPYERPRPPVSSLPSSFFKVKSGRSTGPSPPVAPRPPPHRRRQAPSPPAAPRGPFPSSPAEPSPPAQLQCTWPFRRAAPGISCSPMRNSPGAASRPWSTSGSGSYLPWIPGLHHRRRPSSGCELTQP
jgi:hypothetical protein